ncbi:MAG: rhodanese-like domain-containing protein [Phycisphaerales bacterium JB039]
MKTIDARKLNEIMERDDAWVLVDVLPQDSYEKRHIPGAHSAPFDEASFVDRVEKLVESPDDTVILYCASTDCDLSPKAARALDDAGYRNVLDFEGGLAEWKQAGYQLAGADTAGQAH